MNDACPALGQRPDPRRERMVYSAVQSQNAVSAYFASEQILSFGFAEQFIIRGDYAQVAGVMAPRGRYHSDQTGVNLTPVM